MGKRCALKTTPLVTFLDLICFWIKIGQRNLVFIVAIETIKQNNQKIIKYFEPFSPN